MGSGRDKRKKHEDPAKAAKRAARQAQKAVRGSKHADPNGEAPEGFNNEEAIELTLTRIRKEEQKKRATVEKENVPPPSPRANVVFVPHPLRESDLCVFGGELWNGDATIAYNDLYIYDTVKQRWGKVDTPVNPSPRSSAQGVVYKHFMIVHGGEFVSQSQSQFMHFKDVWRFDFRTYQWEELKNLKGGPSSRSGHRMALWKRQAVVFGGFYDNVQECKYFNDLWILSELESIGHWRQVTFPAHNEPPHPRSGHAVGLHQDAFFVYGGYSSSKFNRFKKTEATVHHDLWMTTLSAAQPVWTKIRLGGIPPPIRSGVAATVKDRRLLLFGGVVDIEAPGGKMVSTFHNDLFAFHMDTQRFYPLVLQPPKKKGASAKDGKAEGLNSLAAELAELKLGSGSGARKGDSDDDDDEEMEYDIFAKDDDETVQHGASETGPAIAAASAPGAGGASHDMKGMSQEVTRLGQILPHRRMDASLCAVGNHLYLFGGQFESGKKEITITDLFSLNLNTMQTWNAHCLQDLGATAWVGKDSESDAANSWESGSTVVSAVMFGDHGGSDEEDEEHEDAEDNPENRGEGADAAPDAIPMELDQMATPALDDIAGSTADGRTTIRGKKGMQMHKAQLLQQLDASSLVPTPSADEPLLDFFNRTQTFWKEMAAEAITGSSDLSKLNAKVLKRCDTEGRRFCKTRYDEAIVLMAQLKMVEEREREEEEFFKQLREKKQKDWEEEEARQRQLEAEGENDSSDTEQCPTAAPVAVASHQPSVQKSILKKEAAAPQGPGSRAKTVDVKAALAKGKAADTSDEDDDEDEDDE